jgi:hypothetical protein
MTHQYSQFDNPWVQPGHPGAQPQFYTPQVGSGNELFALLLSRLAAASNPAFTTSTQPSTSSRSRPTLPSLPCLLPSPLPLALTPFCRGWRAMYCASMGSPTCSEGRLSCSPRWGFCLEGYCTTILISRQTMVGNVAAWWNQTLFSKRVCTQQSRID